MPERKILFTVAGIFCLMLTLNVLYPFMSDDYTFLYVWRGDYGSMFSMPIDYPIERIENIEDVWASLKSLYFTWGGRLIIWSLAYFFANMPHIVFDVANSFMFMVFLLLLTMLGTHTFSLCELNYRYLGLAFIFLWGTSAMFANSYLWLAGSVGYLWPGVAQLLFLFLYVRTFWTRKNLPPPWLMFIVGILAGHSNENSGAVTILLALILTICAKRNGYTVTTHIWGIVGAVVGYMVLIAAPGNFARMSYTTVTPTGISDLSRQYHNVSRALLCCVPSLIAYLWLYRLRGSAQKDKSRFLAKLFFWAGLLNAAVMVPLPNFPVRSLTFTAVFWLIGALIFLRESEEVLAEKPVRLLGSGYLVVTVLSLVSYIYAMAAYFVPQDAWRDAMAASHTGQELVLPPYHAPDILGNLVALKGYRADCGTLDTSPTCWENRLYADLWQLKSVRREKFFVADE